MEYKMEYKRNYNIKSEHRFIFVISLVTDNFFQMYHLKSNNKFNTFENTLTLDVHVFIW